MSFAGIVWFDRPDVDASTRGIVSRALAARAGSDVAGCASPNAFFVHTSKAQLHPLGGNIRVGHSGPRPFVIGAGQLDNRAELADALGIAAPDRSSQSDMAFLAGMFERWGDGGIARCLGAFSFAHWDSDARQLTLGRDCLGQRSLFFHRTEHFAVFSNRLSVLLALPFVPREIDEIALANFVALAARDPRRTVYNCVDRAPSRSLVSIDKTSARHRIYWQPNLQAYSHLRREMDYVEQARVLFDQAVLATIAGEQHVAIATTGGLDSSAIAATVARLGCCKSIACYTMVAPPEWQVDIASSEYRDERDKVLALVRMYPQLDAHFVVRNQINPHYLDDRAIFARSPVPTIAPLEVALGPTLVETVLADGYSALLNGVFGNDGLSWSGAASLRALLREGAWATFAREWRAVARNSGNSMARIAWSEVLLPGGPQWLRRSVHRLRNRDPDDVSDYSAISAEFAALHDLPGQWRQEGVDPWRKQFGWSSVPERIRMLFDNAQPHRDAIGDEFGRESIDLRNPHIDRRLLEFSLAVPEHFYRRNGVPRSFARAVFADRLPLEIVNERRVGTNSTPWFSVLDRRRQEYAAEIARFENSPLASKLLDLPRLKRLLADWPKDEHEAQRHEYEYCLAFARGMHVGRFIKWVEGSNN